MPPLRPESAKERCRRSGECVTDLVSAALLRRPGVDLSPCEPEVRRCPRADSVSGLRKETQSGHRRLYSHACPLTGRELLCSDDSFKDDVIPQKGTERLEDVSQNIS